MRFVCESCRAQYMINDEKVGPKGVKVRCRKCGYVILVKRTDAPPPRASSAPAGPVPLSNDPDDATATQVMQTPLASSPDATLSSDDRTHDEPVTAVSGRPGANAETKSEEPGPQDSFFGADEDEIGAVFDQVLKTGTGNNPALGSEGLAPSASSDDRQSTRVIDADTVRKLAEESNGTPETKAEDVPQTDWYVAINEKQTGPLTLEKIKEHWDRGEVSPDSLCWRAGFDDWIPLSEVKMLAGVLAPKPPKPIVVAPAATITASTPAVVSVPVQSAFSAGGVVQTVQSEVQVPMAAAAAGPEESGSWKPSAASALASLVRDEMEALARPPPKVAVAEESTATATARGGGLLDLPSEERATNAAVVAPMPTEAPAPRPPPPGPIPVNPYLANPGATYSAPALTQYRPPSNRGLVIAISVVGGVMLLVIVGLIVWMATREPTVVVQPPVAVVTPPVAATPTPTPTPTPAPTQVAVTATAPNPTAANPAAANPVVPAPAAANPAVAPGPAAVAPSVPSAPVAVAPVAKNPGGGGGSRPSRGGGGASPSRAEKPDPEPEQPKKTAPSKGGGEGDAFDEMFGGKGGSAAKEEAPPAAEKKSSSKYIPPAPGGGGDMKESLQTSDIMEVVVANKAALAACTAKKEAGTSGKILMKWQVLTSGKTSSVGVAPGSEDFKGTPLAACFGNVIKGMAFPRHKKQGDPIVFPFKF